MLPAAFKATARVSGVTSASSSPHTSFSSRKHRFEIGNGFEIADSDQGLSHELLNCYSDWPSNIPEWSAIAIAILIEPSFSPNQVNFCKHLMTTDFNAHPKHVDARP